MGMAAILVMWPGLFEQTFVPLSHKKSIRNFILIGPVVSKEKMFAFIYNNSASTYSSTLTSENSLFS